MQSLKYIDYLRILFSRNKSGFTRAQLLIYPLTLEVKVAKELLLQKLLKQKVAICV